MQTNTVTKQKTEYDNKNRITMKMSIELGPGGKKKKKKKRRRRGRRRRDGGKAK